MGILDAPAVTPAMARRLRRRDMPGTAGIPTVASVLPSITWGAQNAATQVSGAVTIGAARKECFAVYGANLTLSGNTYISDIGGPWAIEFTSDSPKWEFMTIGKGGAIRFMADGQYLQDHAMTGKPSNGQGYRILVDWTGTAQPRKARAYRVEISGNFSFTGIAAVATDTVFAAPYKGRRVAGFGDSYTEPTIVDFQPRPVTGATGQATGDTITKTAHGVVDGEAICFVALTGGAGLTAGTVYSVINPTTNTFQVSTTVGGSAVDISTDYTAVSYSFPVNTGHDGWVGILGKMLGCPDTWCLGSGGTGYVNPGSGGRVKFRDRFTSQAINNNIELLFLAGGINDGARSPSITAAMVTPEVAGILADRKAGLPNCEVRVISPFVGKMGSNLQPGGGTESNLSIRDAIKLAVDAAGEKFIDLMESGITGQATTITTASIGSAITTNDSLPGAAIVRIGAPGAAHVWTTRVSSVTGSAGSYTVFVSPNLQVSAPVGTTVKVVGAAYINGTGFQGTFTGDGNSELCVGSDGTHPTVYGHENIARLVFAQFVASLDA